MKNKNVIILVATVVVLLVLGFAWNTSRTGSSSQNQNASSTDSLTNVGGGMQATSSQTSSATNTSSKPSVGGTKGGTTSGTAGTPSSPSTNPPVYACTMDARICPDGSAVGRSGPKCEFTACPGETSGTGANTGANTSGTANTQTSTSLNQTIIAGGVYITPTKVVSDSRCPADVTCVWAGEVKLAVHLEKKVMGENKSADVTFISGTIVNFQGSSITLVDVQPQQKSKSSILDKDYVFTFKVN